MGTFLGFLTYFAWAIGDIFGIYSSRKIGSFLATFYVFIAAFFVASLYVPFALNELRNITPFLLLINILFGIVVLTGNYMINEAFRTSNASLIGIIVQSFPAAVVVLSWLLFKDPITLNQAFWIVIIFFGVFLCTISLSDLKGAKFRVDRGVRLTLIATFGFTIYFTFLRIFIAKYGWFWPNYIAIASFPLAIFTIRKVFKIKEKIKLAVNKKAIVSAFLSG